LKTNAHTRYYLGQTVLKCPGCFRAKAAKSAENAKKKKLGNSSASKFEQFNRDMGFQSPCVKRKNTSGTDQKARVTLQLFFPWRSRRSWRLGAIWTRQRLIAL